MSKNNKVRQVEKQKRIYEVSLMLRRKPTKYIIEFVRQNWGIERAQAYKYIALARNEWKKYFENVKQCGMNYHIAQMRDLKDKAFSADDLRLTFDIAKEEAKLMDVYPADKHKVDLTEEIIVIGGKKEEEETEK